jgi:hypothetical protein
MMDVSWRWKCEGPATTVGVRHDNGLECGDALV